MARLAKTRARWPYLLNALVLILPVWFYLQGQNVSFPPALAEKAVAGFTVTLMPLDEEPPYQHDGVYVKDFMLTFSDRDIEDIRQGFLSIGEKPLSLNALQQRDEGILHGSKHAQHVHARASERLSPNQKIWLTLQDWDGQLHHKSWAIPAYLTDH